MFVSTSVLYLETISLLVIIIFREILNNKISTPKLGIFSKWVENNEMEKTRWIPTLDLLVNVIMAIKALNNKLLLVWFFDLLV